MIREEKEGKEEERRECMIKRGIIEERGEKPCKRKTKNNWEGER